MTNKKKELGQFFTNENIADFMANLVVDDKTISVLDPAVGQGAFVSSCQKINNNIKITAYDIDELMINFCHARFKSNTSFIHNDYLNSYFKDKYDAIICNPPYNKFQEIEDRKTYIKKFKEKYQISISGYSNLCVYFLIKSLNEMEENGKCIYIIPYEFLNTGYGIEIKKYILATKKLKTIFKFNNNINLFKDAITTSCIMYFDNKENQNIDFVTINSERDLLDVNKAERVSFSINELNPSDKWIKYFTNKKEPYNNLVSFHDIAKVKRGIATGCNQYFNLNKSIIEEYNLSKNVLEKCICKSPDVKTIFFNDIEFEKLYASNKYVYVFNGLNATSDNDKNYINIGLNKKVNLTYLNSHRTPWYLLENKDCAPIWVSVFNRDKIKFIRNETDSKNLTTFHGIFMKIGYEKLTNILFCYLLTPISQQILKENKREYGNGLDKFEPNDLNNAKIIDIRLIHQDDIKKIDNIYNELKCHQTSELIDELNCIFIRYV